MLKNFSTGSILVFAPQRTGSSMFCEYVSKLYNIENCAEVFNYDENTSQNNNLENLAFKNNFVAKVYDIDNLTSSILQNKNIYKVRLSRRNINEAIASFYIAVMKNKWHTNSYETTKTPRTIAINRSILHKEINNYLHIVKMYKSFKTEYDEVLYYEDFIDQINKTGIVSTKKNIKPLNYQKLLNEIDQIKFDHQIKFDQNNTN